MKQHLKSTRVMLGIVNKKAMGGNKTGREELNTGFNKLLVSVGDTLV